jgi:hypothetical protein
MPTAQDVRAQLEKDGILTATLSNSILSPFDGTGTNLYLLTFHTFIPSEIQFYSYGATVTIQVEYIYTAGGTPTETKFTLTAGQYQIKTTPPGVKRINAAVQSATVTDPSFAYLCTTFPG